MAKSRQGPGTICGFRHRIKDKVQNTRYARLIINDKQASFISAFVSCNGACLGRLGLRRPTRPSSDVSANQIDDQKLEVGNEFTLSPLPSNDLLGNALKQGAA